jgi:site-specific DNA-cytosine methylase
VNKAAIDLFCGGGGAGLAMARVGLAPVGVDLDPVALEIYRQAAGEAVLGNVAQIDPATVCAAPALIWASPPCQPWSEGRRNQGRAWGFALWDGQMLLEPVRWVEALKPQWAVIENVDGLPDDAIASLTARLAEFFPTVTLLRLDASGWLPQRRGHVFVIGGPAPVAAPAPPGGGTFASIMDGQDAKPVKAQHLKYAMKKSWGVPVVTPDSLLPTVSTRPYSERWTAFVMPNDGYLRFPTFLEAARAQGFPDEHPIHALNEKHPGAAWRLLGNAVPVPLAEAVLQAIFSAEGEERGKRKKV